MPDHQNRQVLEIPPRLYSSLTEWRHFLSVPRRNHIAHQWADLLSTQEFTHVVLEDTPNNLIGLLRAFAAFPNDENIKAAKQAVESVSITVIEDLSGEENQEQREVFGSLPSLLAEAICQMTGLQTISLELEPFTEEEGLKLYNGTMIGQPQIIWPEMHSIRMRGRHTLPAGIMCRCDRLKIKVLNLDGWTKSRAFVKAKAVRNLTRLRLYHRKDQRDDPANDALDFPSTRRSTWKELRDTSVCVRSLKWIVIEEEDCDKSNEFPLISDYSKLEGELETVLKGLKRIKPTRLAFTFDYRRFDSRVIRTDMGAENPTSSRLESSEIKQWHELRINYLMGVRKLQEIWIFTHSALAFVETRNNDGMVTVERRDLDAETNRSMFPWKLLYM
ncbi:hypothetical protein FLONG3_11422 [Fusarium longipes]|uniref:Uncharacterized protein n=1 Tax=Fusarium longipes TaxID=694270 RepID=A0A395RFN4_9HYPO|nr:hypothetical protein FLONG3_11422 [Fusarium longipes]